MIRVNWLCLGKTLAYEIDYLLRKFRLLQAFIFVVFLLVLIVISLGDTQSFFIGENSPIPNSWRVFKDEKVVNVISILIIGASYFLPWLSDFLISQKESKDLSSAIEENLIPAIGIELKQLKRRVRQRFHLDESVRVSLFIPVRRGLFRWSLQMVCRTDNIPDRELLAKFQLDEGVIGYTFLKNQKHCMEFINVSDPRFLPASYSSLTSENETLINRSIQAVLVAAAFQEGSVAGLLAIDTDNDQNILKMEDPLLHDDALDWIIARSKAIRLLWRMKNNV
jgi:hypothetical protein